MQLRLPVSAADAKEVLENVIAKEGSLHIGKYNSSYSAACVLQQHQIEIDETVENSTSLYLTLTYKIPVLNKYDKFELVQKTQRLKLLSTKGDRLWPASLRVKIWDNVYPTTVAISEETGIVYLVYLTETSLKLVEFALLDSSQLDAITQELNDASPFHFALDDTAMFDYIAEIEGTKKLRETLYINFDCGVPVCVYSNQNIGV